MPVREKFNKQMDKRGNKIWKLAKRWYGSERQLPPANVTRISR